MKLSETFRRLVLSELELRHRKGNAGRPKTLGEEEALDCAFKVLRTGMQ